VLRLARDRVVSDLLPASELEGATLHSR